MNRQLERFRALIQCSCSSEWCAPDMNGLLEKVDKAVTLVEASGGPIFPTPAREIEPSCSTTLPGNLKRIAFILSLVRRRTKGLCFSYGDECTSFIEEIFFDAQALMQQVRETHSKEPAPPIPSVQEGQEPLTTLERNVQGCMEPDKHGNKGRPVHNICFSTFSDLEGRTLSALWKLAETQERSIAVFQEERSYYQKKCNVQAEDIIRLKKQVDNNEAQRSFVHEANVKRLETILANSGKNFQEFTATLELKIKAQGAILQAIKDVFPLPMETSGLPIAVRRLKKDVDQLSCEIMALAENNYELGKSLNARK